MNTHRPLRDLAFRRLGLVASVALLFLTGLVRGRAAVLSVPLPVEIVCPVCSEEFVYIASGPPAPPTIHTCPWCLYTAPQPLLSTVDPEDAPAIRRALADAADTLDDRSREVFGVSLDDVVTWRGANRYVQSLLAVLCNEPRRDAWPQSSILPRYIHAQVPDEAVRAHLRRRLWEAMEREVDEPIRLEHDHFLDETERRAFVERRRIERLAAVAELRIEHDFIHDGVGLLHRAIEEVAAWRRLYGRHDIRWAGQVDMIAERARVTIELAEIKAWSVQELEAASREFDFEREFYGLVNRLPEAALKELKRRDDPESAAAITRFARQSWRHLRLASRLGLLDFPTMRADPELATLARNLATAIPDREVPIDINDVHYWWSIHRFTQRILAPDIPDSRRTAEEIDLYLEERSIRRSLEEPFYATVRVTKEELARESPFGFQRNHLPDVIPDLASFEDLTIGHEVRLPVVPEAFARSRWPASSMWSSLGTLIQQGSQPALDTVLRWVPTIGDAQLRYSMNRDRFDRILLALCDRSELWPRALATPVNAVTPLQQTYRDSLRACAGDKEAAKGLADLLHNAEVWDTQEIIALVALRALGDRTVLERALTMLPDADWRVRRQISEYVGSASGVDDLPRLSETVAALRLLPPEPRHFRRDERLERIRSIESVILDVRLRQLIAASQR